MASCSGNGTVNSLELLITKFFSVKNSGYIYIMKKKTLKQLKNEALKLYGGLNTKNPAFNVGDKLKQIWRIDENNNLAEGREMVEFVGMKGDLMLLKTLNFYAAHSEDTINPEVVKMSKKAGYKPEIGQVLQLHYMYADRYKILK